MLFCDEWKYFNKWKGKFLLREIEHFFYCPYCLQRISMLFENSSKKQEYVEDCEVCCQPIQVAFEIEGEKISIFRALQLDSL